MSLQLAALGVAMMAVAIGGSGTMPAVAGIEKMMREPLEIWTCDERYRLDRNRPVLLGFRSDVVPVGRALWRSRVA